MSQFQENQELKYLGVIDKDAPVAKISQFKKICQDLNLNPYRSELFLSKKYHPELGNIFVIFAGINGLTKIAHATGEYSGCDNPIYDNERKSCSVTVYRNGNSFPALVFHDEYAPKDNVVWSIFPSVMLAKVAKAHALRNAFPELNMLYIEEEFEQYMDTYLRSGPDKRIENQLDDLIKKIKK